MPFVDAVIGEGNNQYRKIYFPKKWENAIFVLRYR